MPDLSVHFYNLNKLMVPACDGQSQWRERTGPSASLRSPFPPLTLTKKGRCLPADNKTHRIVSASMNRKSEILLDIKKDASC